MQRRHVTVALLSRVMHAVGRAVPRLSRAVFDAAVAYLGEDDRLRGVRKPETVAEGLNLRNPGVLPVLGEIHDIRLIWCKGVADRKVGVDAHYIERIPEGNTPVRPPVSRIGHRPKVVVLDPVYDSSPLAALPTIHGSGVELATDREHLAVLCLGKLGVVYDEHAVEVEPG